MVFVVSLAVVAAGLRWLAKHPRARAALPELLGRGPNVTPPPLPSEAARQAWPATGYELLGWIRDGDGARAASYLEELSRRPAPPDGGPGDLDRLLDELPPLLAARASLDRWCQEGTDSPWPHLVRGAVLLEAGIRARGRQRADTVSEEAATQMHTQLQRAREDLEEARRRRPDLPSLGALAVRAARYLGDRDAALGAPLDPDHLPSAHQGLITRSPRWSGSPVEMFDWARRVAQDHPDEAFWELLTLEAHAEMAWFETGPDDTLNREYLRRPEIRADLTRIRDRLREAYPDSPRIHRELGTLEDFLDDPEASRTHRERAGELGDPEALVELAFQQDRAARDRADIHDRPAFEEAFARMRRAATLGHPEALRRVGRILRRAARTDRERQAALGWFRLAAARGDPGGHFELGQVYMTGEGAAENRREAARWYRSGWELGEAWSAYMLAALARDGSLGRADPAQVTLWLEEAAKLGHRDAQFELGQRLLEGLGDPSDPRRGAAYIRAAAAAGHPRAREFSTRLPPPEPN